MRRLLPQAMAVVCLAGATTAFAAGDKSVQLSIDGKPSILHTFADDVAGLLDDRGIVVGPHDLVAPAPRTRLVNGARVTVRHAHRLRLTLDGRRRQVWTTARTVDGALRVLGVRPEGAYLSVPGFRRIGRGGLTLEVRTARTVRITADGSTRVVRTNAGTVRDTVSGAGIRLHGTDVLSVPPGSFPRDGSQITVTRIGLGRRTVTESVPYPVVRTDDPHLPRGTEKVTRHGRPGVRRVTYATRTVDGVEQPPQRLTAETVTEPRAERRAVGTGPRTARHGTARHGAAHHRHAGRHGSDGAPERSGHGTTGAAPPGRAGGLNWTALAKCESGGRPDAVDPSGTYGGLYQFDVTTWQGLGGHGLPQDAPPAEQTRLAQRLYADRGAQPWPVCGRHLFD